MSVSQTSEKTTVLGFEYQSDAERFHKDLRERIHKFALELDPDKTRTETADCDHGFAELCSGAVVVAELTT